MTFTILQFSDSFNQSSCIFGAPQKVCRFFKRLIVRHRNHYNCSFSFTSYRHRRVVIANLLHRFGKIASSRGIAYAFHCVLLAHVRKCVRSVAMHNKGVNLSHLRYAPMRKLHRRYGLLSDDLASIRLCRIRTISISDWLLLR